MELALNINDRIREYGYIFWTKKNDFEIYELLGKRQEIDVVVDGKELGKKNIDWKNRRISISYTVTRSIPSDKESMMLTLDSKNRLSVSFN